MPKPVCKYGAKCYRNNPQHLEEYEHPTVKQRETEDKSPPRKKQKINEFFTPVEKSTDKKQSADLDKKKIDSGNQSGYVREEMPETSDSSKGTDSKESISFSSPEEEITARFLVQMPKDFYHFWDFCKENDSKKPADCLHKVLDLRLVGPYDILAKKCQSRNKHGKPPCYLTHWRYFYDPPEFMTVLRGNDKTQFHMGYFRDDPKEMPCFVASNEAQKSCTITPRGDNIFAAVCWCIDEKIKKDGKTVELSRLRAQLSEYAEKHEYSLALNTPSMKKRQKAVVTKTFHGAGMVVPVDANEVGYRELPETDGDLKKMLKKIAEADTDEERIQRFDPLTEIITFVQFANDECDYGQGLELGIDLFCFGHEIFTKTVLNILPLAYELLGRTEYKQIIEAHMKNRRHGTDLSEFE